MNIPFQRGKCLKIYHKNYQIVDDLFSEDNYHELQQQLYPTSNCDIQSNTVVGIDKYTKERKTP